MSSRRRKEGGGETEGAGASGMGRREMLRRVGTIPIAAGLALSSARVQAAQEHVHKSAAKATAGDGKPYAPRFFTPHEWVTVWALADVVIPADERKKGNL